mmetsp:Transcript_41299/g.116909  ORF Transcript_41299/g.116909 Transcript_41299/m.116909 type:complete len:291 (-) Transcript_41299:241-1113(-)
MWTINHTTAQLCQRPIRSTRGNSMQSLRVLLQSRCSAACRMQVPRRRGTGSLNQRGSFAPSGRGRGARRRATCMQLGRGAPDLWASCRRLRSATAVSSPVMDGRAAAATSGARACVPECEREPLGRRGRASAQSRIRGAGGPGRELRPFLAIHTRAPSSPARRLGAGRGPARSWRRGEGAGCAGAAGRPTSRSGGRGATEPQHAPRRRIQRAARRRGSARSAELSHFFRRGRAGFPARLPMSARRPRAGHLSGHEELVAAPLQAVPFPGLPLGGQNSLPMPASVGVGVRG